MAKKKDRKGLGRGLSALMADIDSGPAAEAEKTPRPSDTVLPIENVSAQQALQHEIPVIIRDFDDEELLEVGIIENVQRADLNAVEEALGYRALMDKFGHTQEQVSTAAKEKFPLGMRGL